jgi:hypothetical protein
LWTAPDLRLKGAPQDAAPTIPASTVGSRVGAVNPWIELDGHIAAERAVGHMEIPGFGAAGCGV